MNKFEATQQFRASLQAANVPQQQRGALVRAFNAALALGSDAETRQDARNLTYEVARGEILLRSLSFALGGVSLASAAVMWSRGGDYGGWSFFALVNAFLGGGAVGLIRSVPVMVELRELYAQMAVEVGDWLDEEPEPEAERKAEDASGQRRFVRQDDQRRYFVSTYEFSDKHFEDIANMAPGAAVSRPTLEGLGWSGLTSYFRYKDSGDQRIGSDGKAMTVLAVIQEDLSRAQWIDSSGKITRYGINQARDQLRANSPTG